MAWRATDDEDEDEDTAVSNEYQRPGASRGPCPTCGYKYGSAWLYEPIPLDVEPAWV